MVHIFPGIYVNTIDNISTKNNKILLTPATTCHPVKTIILIYGAKIVIIDIFTEKLCTYLKFINHKIINIIIIYY